MKFLCLTLMSGVTVYIAADKIFCLHQRLDHNDIEGTCIISEGDSRVLVKESAEEIVLEMTGA